LFDIQEELKKLPQKPGVYLFIGGADEVLYVGKAVNLRSRVRSYFTDANFVIPKIQGIRASSRRFEYIVTDNETEALILECNLIKEHWPKFNVLLKDDKSYPYIKVTLNEDFPRVFSTREFAEDGAKYFGPYTSSFAVKESVEQIHRLWGLRRCARKIDAGAAPSRPCLNHHIGLCAGACGGFVAISAYMQGIERVLEFLSGKHDLILRGLESEMAEASENLEFEKAASLRDKIAAIRSINENQRAERISKGDQDIIAFALNGDEALFQVFFIRDGKITGREHFMVSGVADVPNQTIMTQFVTQFYSGTPFVPKELVLQFGLDDEGTIASWLQSQRGKKVEIFVPVKGDKARLVKMAYNNAVITLEQFGKHIKLESARTTGAVEEIRAALGFDAPIFRIEAYDISNIQGFENVGSMVVFEGGKPRRSDYRKFKIKSLHDGDINDYAAMQEVMSRRFKRLQTESKGGFSRLPDIIFVDGGKGHVSAALEVLDHMEFSIPICGMVKDAKHRTKALLYGGKEITLPAASEGFKLITRIQDETHRFAVEYHRKLRQKSAVKSVLDDIPGVGSSRKKALILRFGSVDAIKLASLEQLAETPGITKKTAQAVYEFFRLT